MNLQASFEHKPSDFSLRDCVIEKTVKLSEQEFQAFLNHPLRDYDFLAENIELMRSDGNGTFHCLLVTGAGRNDGMLVKAEGYSYCRYASYVPNISAMNSQVLQELNEKLSEAVDFIIADGTQNTSEGSGVMYFDELEKQTGLNVEFNDIVQNTLADMLSERKEVAECYLNENSFDIVYYLDFCPNCNIQEEESLHQAEPPTEHISKLKNLLHTQWEDIHLVHKDVEINPCTIVELQDDTLTEAGKEAWSDVLNADVIRVYMGVYGLQMEISNIKPSRLEDFSVMLAGNCSVQDYEKWVTADKECCQTLEM
ncbi:TPA: hypothetical protein K8G92_002531 [Listeria monocytogenes]|nr:hypothetical protein [Listeria monocytogenes]